MRQPRVSRLRRAASAAIACLLLCAACSTSGVYHRVRRGQTLSQIGAAYGVPYGKIADANDIDDPSKIYAGQKLLIPGADRVVSVPSAPAVRRSRKRAAQAREAPILQWPIQGGRVSSFYGPRWGRFHDGIDIATGVGTPVRAAAGGEVVYDGRLSGYGRVIILRHSAGYSTLYAHNSRHYVKKGQWVRRGDRIAAVGRTGRTTGPNLHFEVRIDNRARDPMLFLGRRAAR